MGAGKLFVPAFADDTLRRYTRRRRRAELAATAPLPTGSEPDGITLGPEGQVFATLHGTGKVVALAPDAADGVAPRVVADGLDHPVGIAADQNAYAGGVGRPSSGRQRPAAWRIDEDGTQGWIDLPADFAPGQVVVKGNDIWVTDLAGRRLAHVQETGPILADHPDVDPATGTASISVDPNGSRTVLGFVVDGLSETFASWEIDGSGPRTLSVKLDHLTPGATDTVDAYYQQQARHHQRAPPTARPSPTRRRPTRRRGSSCPSRRSRSPRSPSSPTSSPTPPPSAAPRRGPCA